MAVQQNKSTRATRGMRRSHHILYVPEMSIDTTSKELHRRHHITANGFYRGSKMIKI